MEGSIHNMTGKGQKKRNWKEIFKMIGVVLVSLIWVSLFVYGSGYATNHMPLTLIWQSMIAWVVTFGLYMILEYVCVNIFECSKYVYMICTMLFAFPVIMLTGPFFSVLFQLSSVKQINRLISKAIIIYSILVPSRIILIPIEIAINKKRNKHKFM